MVKRLNVIRRENPALHSDRRLRFHGTDNELLLCYSKTTADLTNVILVVANLDVHHRQSGWVHLDLEALGLDAPELGESLGTKLAEASLRSDSASNRSTSAIR